MNLHELRILVDSHYWARDRILDAAEQLPPEQLTKDLGNSFVSIRDTLVHLYGADRIWCSGWENESPQSMPDPTGFPDVWSIRRAWNDHEKKIRAVLEQRGDKWLAQLVEYKTLAGQVLQHLPEGLRLRPRRSTLPRRARGRTQSGPWPSEASLSAAASSS